MNLQRFLFSVIWFVIIAIPAHPLENILSDGAASSEFPLSDDEPVPDQEIVKYFMHQKNYIPGSPLNTVVKTINLSINVWQMDDGTGNLPDNDGTRERLNLMVERLNRLFSSSAMPYYPIEGIDYLRDSHIRFALKDIIFIRNSDYFGVGCGDGSRMNQYVFREYPQNRRYLNIHLNRGQCRGASGYATYPSGVDIEADGFVVSFIRENIDLNDYPSWGFMLHVAHELGHNLDLRHPYDSEYCSFNHPDFLFDLFGSERQEWCTNPRRGCDVCYHQGGWRCDIHDPETTCTNNLMGGNRDPGSITPLQMGRMNRALALRSMRKYTWGYSDVPYTIDKDQHWPFNIKFYQDIRVEAGKTFIISGTLEMVPQAAIILEPGAKLLVDGGKITNALYSESSWRGIIKEETGKGLFSFLRKKQQPAEVIISNGGTIENAIAW